MWEHNSLSFFFFLNVVKCSLPALFIVFCLLSVLAHQGVVTVVLFVLEMEWVLSTGQDKSFTWHCSESGQQLGTYRTTAWVSGLQYPFLRHFRYEISHKFLFRLYKIWAVTSQSLLLFSVCAVFWWKTWFGWIYFCFIRK